MTSPQIPQECLWFWHSEVKKRFWCAPKLRWVAEVSDKLCKSVIPMTRAKSTPWRLRSWRKWDRIHMLIFTCSWVHHLLGGGVPRACPPPSCTTCPACSPRPKARSGRISAETLRYCLPPADARPCLSMVGMKVAFLDSYVVLSCFSLPKIAMRCMASARVHEHKTRFSVHCDMRSAWPIS